MGIPFQIHLTGSLESKDTYLFWHHFRWGTKICKHSSLTKIALTSDLSEIWWLRCWPMVFMGRKAHRKWKAFAWFFVTSFGALLYSIKCSNATSDSIYSQQHHIPGDQQWFDTNADNSGTCNNKPSAQKWAKCLILVLFHAFLDNDNDLIIGY